VPNQGTPSQSTSSDFSSRSSSTIANRYQNISSGIQTLQCHNQGTREAIIWTAERISETPRKHQMTCFFPPGDKLGKNTANTFSYLQWPPTTCTCMPVLNTELNYVAPSHFLSNLGSLQHMHQSGFIASSSF
jgi:hypothetical protein